MVVFESAQIVSLPDKISVDRLSVLLNLPTQVFFFPQLLNQVLFLTLETVKLFPEFGVQVTFEFKVFLQVAIDHVLEAGNLVEFVF